MIASGFLNEGLAFVRPSLVYTQGAHSGAVDDAKNRQVGIRGVKLTPSLSQN